MREIERNFMSTISFEELDGLSGELLPERSVLSVVTPFNNAGGGGHGGGSSSSAAAFGGDGGHGGAISSSACQAPNNQGTAGLVGALGLGAQIPNSSLTCAPASTAVF
jgi:hypothetical protein